MIEHVQAKTVTPVTSTTVHEKPVLAEVIERPTREVHHRKHVTEIHEKPHIIFREEPVTVNERAPTQVQHVVDKTVVIDEATGKPTAVPNPYQQQGSVHVQREAELRSESADVVNNTVVEQQTYEIHKQPVVTRVVDKPVIEMHDQEIVHRVRDAPVVTRETVAPMVTEETDYIVPATTSTDMLFPYGTTVTTTVPVYGTTSYMVTTPSRIAPMLVNENVRYVPVEREHRGIMDRVKNMLGVGSHKKIVYPTVYFKY